MADWIDAFMAYTEGVPSPRIFRLWSGISAISGILERRTWVKTARSLVFPNIYTLLVAAPGVGKTQAIDPAGDILTGVEKIHICPDNVTKAALIDVLKESQRVYQSQKGPILYHSLFVPAGELGVFLTAHDLEFLSVINKIYDNPRTYRENRRHNVNKAIDIPFPHMTILAGTQPGFLSGMLPEEAWSMGFCSRLIMVYSGETPNIDLFAEDSLQEDELRNLSNKLKPLLGLYGPFHWEPDAQTAMQHFNDTKRENEPTHTKLIHYNSRRTLHMLKLVQIAAISARQELRITINDVTRATDWLLEAEIYMPDIFRAMERKSDKDILSELHYYLWRDYQKTQRPVHEARIINFLTAQIPSDRIPRLMEIAERAGMIQRMAGTKNMYVPRPQHEHGLE